MKRITREPVSIAGAIIVLVKVLVAWLAIMGYVDLSEQQQQMTVALAVAAVDVATLIWARAQSTSLADARDRTGEPLVRQRDGGKAK